MASYRVVCSKIDEFNVMILAYAFTPMLAESLVRDSGARWSGAKSLKLKAVLSFSKFVHFCYSVNYSNILFTASQCVGPGLCLMDPKSWSRGQSPLKQENICQTNTKFIYLQT